MAKKAKKKAGKRRGLSILPSAWRSAPDNPRRIVPEALAGLRASLWQFGDLSGIVLNAATGEIVCGHQRREALAASPGVDPLASIVWDAQAITVELGPAGRRFKSQERRGVLRSAGGAEFRVRAVEWPEWFAKLACVTANNQAIQGEWTDALEELLAEARATAPDAFETLRLAALVGTGSSDAPRKRRNTPTRYQVLVDAGGQELQESLATKLRAEGWKVKTLTL